MPEALIHVSRQGVELGVFPLEEAHELLAANFLLPHDDCWIAGTDDWRPLGEVLAGIAAQTEPPDWRDRLVQGSAALARVAGRRAGRLVGEVKAYVSRNKETLSRAKQIALEQYAPQIAKLAAAYLRDKPAAFVQEAFRSEETMQKVFGAVYDCLPRPVCRFVSEPVFLRYCMEHRQKLLGSQSVVCEQHALSDSAQFKGEEGNGSR